VTDLSVGGTLSMAYEGESRQVTATDTAGVTKYSYDGDGRRVQKVNADGSSVTYVYDVLGGLLAEYSTGPVTKLCTTCYLGWDHLGSPRMITDGSTGAIKALHDYLPFGEEIGSGMAGRTSSQTAFPWCTTACWGSSRGT
jgi:YD repeat-containing protein